MSEVIHIKKIRPAVSEVNVSMPKLINGVWTFTVECDATMVLHDALADTVATGVKAVQKHLHERVHK